jgi:hypothetical protein
MPSMSDFYDRMASLYRLVFQDWNESIERQAGQLSGIIEERWGAGSKRILDVADESAWQGSWHPLLRG